MCKSISTSIVLLLVLLLITQGCATIVHGSHQGLSIRTMPPDVMARIDAQSCVTPCTLRVSRLTEKIQITAEGDTEKVYPLFKKVNTYAFYFGNILLLWPAAFIGAAVDIQTGAQYTIEPVHIVLPNAHQ